MIVLRSGMVSIVLLLTIARAGEYADAFLLASYYPQVQALGYSSVASRVSSGHALNNPAGFAQSQGSHISMVYDQFDALSSNIGLEAVIDSRSNYTYGVTLVHSMVDGLLFRPDLSGLSPGSRRDSVLALQGSKGDPINYREEGVFLSVARNYEFVINLGWKFFKIPCQLPVGISVKYIDKLLVENRGLGSGIDIGSQLIFNLAGMTSLLQNTEFAIAVFFSDILNTPVYWTTEHQDAIKRGVTTGINVTQKLHKYDSEISLSTSRQSRYKNKRQYGFEVGIKNVIIIRAGHDGFTPSLGLGIGLKKFIIDYSFSQHELMDMQKIGINYHF